MKTEKEYYKSMHKVGRIISIGGIVIFVGIPVIICKSFGIMPTIGEIIAVSIGLLAIFVPLAIPETLSYTPIMGSSFYLSSITGNILNLKLPAALNALKLSNIEQGTEKGDVIVGIAVAASSLITVCIIALGVLLLVPLKPILTSAAVKTASNYIIPALFGSLGIGLLGNNIGGGIVIKGRLKAAIIPAILVGILYILSPSMVSLLQGALIIVCLPILYFSTKYLYKKGKIQVILPQDKVEKVESEN
jgi:hypothetical protein